MKKLLLSLFIAIPFCASGQQNGYGWRLGIYGGASSYYGDLSYRGIDAQPFLAGFPNTFKRKSKDYTYGVSIEKNLSPSVGIKVLGSVGQFTANDRTRDFNQQLLTNNPYFQRSLNVQTKLQDLSLLVTYYLDNGKILSQKSFISPYISLGIGVTQFRTYADLYDRNGKQYYYWNDNTVHTAAQESPGAELTAQDNAYETELTTLQTEKSANYSNITANFPLALGLKFRLADQLNLNIEAMARYTMTDYLDDVSGKFKAEYSSELQAYAANPNNFTATQRGRPNDKLNDIYGSLSLSLQYSFGSRGRSNGGFNAPVFYSIHAEPESIPLINPTEETKKDEAKAALVSNEKLVREPVIEDTNTPIEVQKAEAKDAITTVEKPTDWDTVIGKNTTDTNYKNTDTAAIAELRLLNTELKNLQKAVKNMNVDENNADILAQLQARTAYLEQRKTYFNEYKATINTTKNDYLMADYVNLLTQVNTLQSDLTELKSNVSTIKSVNDMMVANNLPFKEKEEKINTITEPIAQIPIIENTKENAKESVKIAPTAKPDATNMDAPKPANPVVTATPEPTVTTIVTNTPTEKLTEKATLSVADLLVIKQLRTEVAALRQQQTESETTLLKTKIANLETQLHTEKKDKEAMVVAALQQQITDLRQAVAQLKAVPIAPEPTAAAPKRTPNNVLATNNVFFASGAAIISTDQKTALEAFVRNAQENDDFQLELRGYTDRSGNPEANLALARRRCEAVRNYLIANGLAASNIQITHSGEAAGAAQKDANSRRVEVVPVARFSTR